MEDSRYIPETEVPEEQTNASLRKLLRESHERERGLRDELAAWKDVLITKLWMTVEEATPADDLLCDVRYQGGGLGYAVYQAATGFTDANDDVVDVITHWKPSPRIADGHAPSRDREAI